MQYIKALGPRHMGRDAVRVSSIHWARGHPVTLFLGTICNPHVTQKRMNNWEYPAKSLNMVARAEDSNP